MFLHGGWLHVLGNMWFLWIFGDNIEDLLGHAQIPVVLSALRHRGGAGPGDCSDPYSTVPMVGASGAIAGVMGAYLVKFPRARILTLVFIIIFITTIEIPAPLMLAYWFVIQLFSGFGSIARTHVSAGRHGVFRAHRRLRGGHGAGEGDGHQRPLQPAAGPLLVMTPRDALHARRHAACATRPNRCWRQPARRAAFEFEEIDIDRHPEWLRAVQRRGAGDRHRRAKAFKYRVTMDEFLKRLAARA